MTEHNPDEVMEPWQPEVGDRVRVHFSGECEAHVDSDSRAGMNGILAGHESEMDANGKTGVVEGIGKTAVHHYTIRMDERYWYGGRDWGRTEAAAIELEPLDKLAEGRVK